MSLSVTLTESIDKVVEAFISRVSGKYNIDSSDLIYIWKGETQKTKNFADSKEPQSKEPQSKEPDSKEPGSKNLLEIDHDNLLNCNKAELIALCKKFNLKCSGTKSILLNRLLGKEQSPVNTKTTKTTKTIKKVEITPVAKKLTANIPNILIRRNQFNNYEHPETGLVFDNSTKIVIGKQNNNGSVDILTEEDIDQCNAFKFKFKLPENLDHKSTLEDVEVDELEDEESEELELEEDDLEEEILDEEELEDEEDEEELEEYFTDE